MKKNILIVRSLLILPLITPTFILNMEKLTLSMEQLQHVAMARKNRLGIQDQVLEAMGKKTPSNEESSTQITLMNIPVHLTETIYLEPLNLEPLPKKQTILEPQNIPITTAETTNQLSLASKNVALLNQLIAEVLAEIQQTPPTIEEPEVLVQETFDPMQMANEKKASFAELHNELLNNDKKLKPTPNSAQATESAPIEDWVTEYQKQAEKYQNLLDAIITNKITLKPTPTNTLDMTQSMVALPMPTKKGIAKSLYVRSCSLKTNDAIELALENGEFEIDNEDHINALIALLESYTEQKIYTKISSILEMCQFATGKLELNNIIGRKLHNFIESIIAEKEKEAVLTFNTKTTTFIETANKDLAALQEEYAQRAEELHKKLTAYQKDRDDSFAQTADDIRRLKVATIITHTLTPQLKLGKNECCSDRIKIGSPTTGHSKASGSQIYMTQADVNSVYSNDRLLTKMELATPKNAITQKSSYLLEHIDAISRSTKTVQLLTQ